MFLKGIMILKHKIDLKTTHQILLISLQILILHNSKRIHQMSLYEVDSLLKEATGHLTLRVPLDFKGQVIRRNQIRPQTKLITQPKKMIGTCITLMNYLTRRMTS